MWARAVTIVYTILYTVIASHSNIFSIFLQLSSEEERKIKISASSKFENSFVAKIVKNKTFVL